MLGGRSQRQCNLSGHSGRAVSHDATMVYSDQYRSYYGLDLPHATVDHGQDVRARDDDGDGVPEVDCNSCEGAGAGLRTFLRPFSGVHKAVSATLCRNL